MNLKSIKTVFKSILFLMAFGLFIACNSNMKSDEVGMEEVSLSEVSMAADYKAVDEDRSMNFAVASPRPIDLKIIKSAQVRYKVDDVKKATNTIKQLAQAQNGYISDQRFEDNLYNKSSRFTIKVPKSTFDGLLDSISKVAEFIEYENITTQDVTEEYIDLETRLKTKMEVKARYEEVLRKNAKTVEDILATEDKLRIIQEEIESAQGRLKYLSSRVAYSSIQVDLYESVEYKEEPKSYTKSFMTKITDGLKFGWEMIEGFILILVHIWPILIVGGLLFLFVRKRLKK